MRQEFVLLSFLLVSGLCHHAGPHRYHVVYELKNWTEAQSYCREKHTDLVTVHSAAAEETLSDLVDLHSLNHNGAWIGLHVDMKDWRFSGASDYKGSFSNWKPGEPNNQGGGEHCGNIYDNGQWNDESCSLPLKAICFSTRGLTETYILLLESMTWTEARRSCRENYTDLASARNRTENENIMKLVPEGEKVWIGLYTNWKWSDGGVYSFSNWNPAQQRQVVLLDCMAAVFLLSGQWESRSCDQRRAFICYDGVKREMRVLRVVRLRVTKDDPSLDLNDPAVMEEMLKQLKQRLKDAGKTEDFTLKWREQSDGKVFHREKEEKKWEEL